MTVLLLALASCDKPDPTPVDPVVDDGPDTRRLFRASMALRGHPPSREEVLELVDDPASLERIVRDMVDDDTFATTMADMHGEQFKLRWDVIAKPPNIHDIAEFDRGAIAYSSDEPPVKLIEQVIMTGRPYTDIITGDMAMSNEISSLLYGLPHDPDGPEWQETWWTDGRPKVGILASSALYQKYQGPDNNRMRTRAAWILEDLLCEDLAERSGSGIIDPRLADDAVRNDPQCVGCHAVMDPIASGIWGFYRHVVANETTAAYVGECQGVHEPRCFPFQFWLPEELGKRAEFGGPPIALYGTPATDLEELAQLIAEEPRFAECTTRRFWGWMTHQQAREIDEALAVELVDVLHESNWDARELAIAVVLHPRFADGSPDAPPRSIRPGQIDRTIRTVTGYEWGVDPDTDSCENRGECWGSVGLATTDKYGLRSLLGGVDSWTIIEPVSGAFPTRELGLDWVATEAAHFVVDRDDAVTPGEGQLLAWGATTDPDLARVQLAELHLRLYGTPVEVDSIEVDQAWALLVALLDVAPDARSAWKSVLTALLQDPRLVVL